MLYMRRRIPGARGYLIWLRDRTLVAQAFDTEKLKMMGEAVPIAQEVGFTAQSNLAHFSASASGILSYGAGAPRLQMTWLSREGRTLGAVGTPGTYVELRLSPDNRKIVAARTDESGNTDIWLIDLARGVSSRVTFAPSIDVSPVWSPDGTQIAYSSMHSGALSVYRNDAGGAGQAVLLSESANPQFVTDWSKQGVLVYHEFSPHASLWLVPAGSSQKPVLFSRSPFNQSFGQVSPDGKWIAYVSDESGRAEVIVRRFSNSSSGAAAKWTASSQGGTYPRWRADGKELFYLAARGETAPSRSRLCNALNLQSRARQ